MPSKKESAEQMLIAESENLSSCSGFDSLARQQRSISTPPLQSSSSLPTSPSSPLCVPTHQPPPPPAATAHFKKSLSMPLQQALSQGTIKAKNYKNINAAVFTEEDFLNGIVFEAKYIGSLDVAKPNSRVEIVAAMRRIRYEFKSKGVKKHKVSIAICTDGIHVSLKRPNKLKFMNIKKNLNKPYGYESYNNISSNSKLLLMTHPIYRVFYVSHDSQDLNIFSYIARDSVTNVFRCNVFKAYKKEQAMLVVRTIGQAFEVCHHLNQRKSTDINEINEDDEDVHEVSATTPLRNSKRISEPKSLKENDNHQNDENERKATMKTELSSELSSPLMYAEDTRLSYGLRQHIQLLTQQIEQQKNEIELITAQMRILKDQLKIETEARFESQAKNLQLISHNRNLLQNVHGLLKYINELETKLGFDSNLNRELYKILNANGTTKDEYSDYKYLSSANFTTTDHSFTSENPLDGQSPFTTLQHYHLLNKVNSNKYGNNTLVDTPTRLQILQQQKANIQSLQAQQQQQTPFFASDYLLNSNSYLKQQLKTSDMSLFHNNSNPLMSKSTNNTSNSSNMNHTNNISPDSGIKETSFDSNISDMFNQPSQQNTEFTKLNIDTSSNDPQSNSDDYKNPSNNNNNNNLNYLYNIKRKLSNLKTNQQQQQQLNDLNKTNSKDNFLITISKKQLNPLQTQNYSLYMSTTSPTETTSSSTKAAADDYKKAKSMSTSSMENCSISEGYDSLKQNDEDIVLKLNMYHHYRHQNEKLNEKKQQKEQQQEHQLENSSEDDEDEKLIKYTIDRS